MPLRQPSRQGTTPAQHAGTHAETSYLQHVTGSTTHQVTSTGAGGQQTGAGAGSQQGSGSQQSAGLWRQLNRPASAGAAAIATRAATVQPMIVFRSGVMMVSSIGGRNVGLRLQFWINNPSNATRKAYPVCLVLRGHPSTAITVPDGTFSTCPPRSAWQGKAVRALSWQAKFVVLVLSPQDGTRARHRNPARRAR